MACQDPLLITRPYSQLKSWHFSSLQTTVKVSLCTIGYVKPIYLYQTYKPKPFSIIQLHDINQLHTKYRER